ncbi:hypothetical protein J6590_051850 [Homalodisca vitripennis]|nr:hypothetical protein J6590_051850 [Homalodisca vitripennis]
MDSEQKCGEAELSTTTTNKTRASVRNVAMLVNLRVDKELLPWLLVHEPRQIIYTGCSHLSHKDDISSDGFIIKASGLQKAIIITTSDLVVFLSLSNMECFQCENWNLVCTAKTGWSPDQENRSIRGQFIQCQITLNDLACDLRLGKYRLEMPLSISASFGGTFAKTILHAISERLKQPCPPAEMFDKCYDFSHVLDFCSQLVTVEVEGSWDPVGTSDIIPNNCAFELSVLKDVKELTLTRVAVKKLYHAGTLRQTLRRLVVSQCGLESVSDMLLCDAVHKHFDNNIPEDRIWQKLEEVDFSQNRIKQFCEY